MYKYGIRKDLLQTTFGIILGAGWLIQGIHVTSWWWIVIGGLLMLTNIYFIPSVFREYKKEKKLKAFIEKSEVVKRLDSEIAASAGATLVPKVSALSIYYWGMLALNLPVSEELDSYLERYHQEIVQLAEIRLRKNRTSRIYSGICLLYLCYVVAGSQKDAKLLSDYLMRVLFPENYNLDDLADDITNVCSK